MALLGDEAKRIPGAYKVGTGTITFVKAATAYLKPDQPEYGDEVYIHGGLSDQNCKYKLDTKYYVGDRVTFTYVPATKPERGCKWVAVDLAKTCLNNGAIAFSSTTNGSGKRSDSIQGNFVDAKSTTSPIQEDHPLYVGRSEVIRRATGRVDYNGIAFAYIQLDPPLTGRAFMADKSVTNADTMRDENGCFSLAKEFPASTRIICDLYPQKERKNCKYFAKNVVISHSKPALLPVPSSPSSTTSAINPSLKFSPPRLPISKPRFSPSSPAASKSELAAAATIGSITPTKAFDCKKEISTPSSTNETVSNRNPEEFGNPMANASVQTEKSLESILLDKLCDDMEIYRVICARQPDVMYRYMQLRRSEWGNK